MKQSALQQYQAVGVNSGLTDADPHQLIAMLITGAADRVASARGAMLRGETARRGELISGAIAIIDSLRASLDRERGGEVADNLGALYDYMERGLLQANLDGDSGRLEEIGALLGEIKAGWEGIPADARQAS